MGSRRLIRIRLRRGGLLRLLLDPSGLGTTCHRIMEGKKIKNISGVRADRLLPCLALRGSRLLRGVHEKGCHPSPIHELRVPGSGNGAHPLNVPAIMSHFIRRTVDRILVPLCRPRFDSGDFNFHPRHDTRSTLRGIRRCTSRNCHCYVNLSLRGFFSHIGRDGLVRILSQAIGSNDMVSLVRGCLGTKIMMSRGCTRATRNIPRNNPLDPVLDGVLLGRLSRRLRHEKRPFIHCTSSYLVLIRDLQTARQIHSDVSRFVRGGLFLGMGGRGARINSVYNGGCLKRSFC